MSATGVPNVLTRHDCIILWEVFKSMNMIKSDCLCDTFKTKHGKHSFSKKGKSDTTQNKNCHIWAEKYYLSGRQIWDDNVSKFSHAWEIDISAHKIYIDNLSVAGRWQ